MNIEYINTPDNSQLIKLRGEMDATGCAHIRHEIENVTNVKEQSNIILDLSLISFLDSSGIGMIVFLYKRLKAQGRSLEVYGVQGQPQELMELLRIDKVIPVSTGSPETLTEKYYA